MWLLLLPQEVEEVEKLFFKPEQLQMKWCEEWETQTLPSEDFTSTSYQHLCIIWDDVLKIHKLTTMYMTFESDFESIHNVHYRDYQLYSNNNMNDAEFWTFSFVLYASFQFLLWVMIIVRGMYMSVCVCVWGCTSSACVYLEGIIGPVTRSPHHTHAKRISALSLSLSLVEIISECVLCISCQVSRAAPNWSHTCTVL